MSYWCGYNPGFSNTVTGIQAGLAGLNGIVNYLDAKNNGANTQQAVAYGLGTTTMGVGNALLGNAIDHTTHSYLGTTMNSVMNTFTGGNPFMTSIGMTGAALATTPMFMTPIVPTFGTFGYYSAWTSPFMFGAPMPMFGHFCCRC